MKDIMIFYVCDLCVISYLRKNVPQTRMQSSRMRTVRCSGRLLGAGCQGGCVPGGVPRAVSAWGCLPGVSTRRVCQGGVCLGGGGGVSAKGCLPRGCRPGGCLPDTSPMNRITDRCKNNKEKLLKHLFISSWHQNFQLFLRNPIQHKTYTNSPWNGMMVQYVD